MKTKITAALGALSVAAALATAFAPAASAGARASGAPQSGGSIHVEGRWTVAVHGRDGGVVSTRRFENALVGDGQLRLISLLMGVSVAPANGAGWEIVWEHTVPGGHTTEALPTIKVHHIASTSWAVQPPYLANITLSGSVAATTATQLLAVGTTLKICVGSYTTATCTSPSTPLNVANFTYKTLDTPLAVAAGQTVDFTVQLYFS